MKYLITTIVVVVLVGCVEANLTKDELALISAVENGKIERVKQRIEAGTNVSPRRNILGTLLCIMRLNFISRKSPNC